MSAAHACVMQVPRNLKLLAVPLFELLDNATKFASVIASIPHLMSRFKLNLAGQQVTAGQPPAAEPADSQQLIVSH